MEILFNEQDLIDSICVYTSLRENITPEQVQADIGYDLESGFSASSLAHGRTLRFNEQDIIDAVADYLQEYHLFGPDSLNIKFSYLEQDGIAAVIQVNNYY
ncbi:hypothetical protein JOC77_001005 [Peribacillus deserti]|uniref:DUF2653 domain-containing protein n=1 Tax=Peribacillus deserti TaxID=673318 RepID=A0ABS2QGI5_9BACI|nr:DUF2653 family protein [Peribacillus deserti]MBM7691598.1 hypothetical protein [Peribacillus deserti]